MGKKIILDDNWNKKIDAEYKKAVRNVKKSKSSNGKKHVKR